MRDEQRYCRERRFTIQVTTRPDFRLECARCNETIVATQVAFLTRTGATEPYDPWCVECSLILSQWALLGVTGTPAVVPFQGIGDN